MARRLASLRQPGMPQRLLSSQSSVWVHFQEGQDKVLGPLRYGAPAILLERNSAISRTSTILRGNVQGRPEGGMRDGANGVLKRGARFISDLGGEAMTPGFKTLSSMARRVQMLIMKCCTCYFGC